MDRLRPISRLQSVSRISDQQRALTLLHSGRWRGLNALDSLTRRATTLSSAQ